MVDSRDLIAKLLAGGTVVEFDTQTGQMIYVVHVGDVVCRVTVADLAVLHYQGKLNERGILEHYSSPRRRI